VANEPGLAALWGTTIAATQPLLLAPFGTFSLDPATAVSFGFQVLSATNSTATYPIQLPAVPALSGATIHWQAATLRGNSVLDARFTNRSSHRVVR